MRIPKLLTRIRDAFNWGLFAYRLVVALAATGVLGAVGGGIWAVLIGVPLPIAIMAGYCTLVGAVYLAIAPLAYRALSRFSVDISVPTAPEPKAQPNYEAWRHVEQLTLRKAAFLWCDREPGISMTKDVVAWLEALTAAVKKGELNFNAKYSGYRHESEEKKMQKINPVSDTVTTRAYLKVFAAMHGYDPIFLRDA
jgi:hypothetical protein